MPLPLPAVVGAAVAVARLSLLAVALGLAEVAELLELSVLPDEEELRAVLDALEDVPAYEAAAT